MSTRFFLFDFDGVLFQSAYETAFSAYNAVTGKTITEAADLPPRFVELYLSHRPCIHPASDILALAEWALENAEAAEPTPMDRARLVERLAVHPVPRVERLNRFFTARERFQAADLNAWLALHRPFQPLWDELCAGTFPNFAILTNKNRAAVFRLCSSHGLSLDPSIVYSGDGGVSKEQNFERLRAEHGAMRYIFLEDQVENLITITTHFPGVITPILATWGYHAPGDMELAARHDIRSVELSRVADLLQA
ncbi:MAG: hypothetical protein IT290_12890 [Deltaproteobacteria bacterium]|nr:hypothetical protein [Deltaproteobacteria bacterium]